MPQIQGWSWRQRPSHNRLSYLSASKFLKSITGEALPAAPTSCFAIFKSASFIILIDDIKCQNIQNLKFAKFAKTYTSSNPPTIAWRPPKLKHTAKNTKSSSSNFFNLFQKFASFQQSLSLPQFIIALWSDSNWQQRSNQELSALNAVQNSLALSRRQQSKLNVLNVVQLMSRWLRLVWL